MNERIWTTALDHAGFVNDSAGGTVLQDPQEKDLFGELKRDLNQLLYKAGALTPHAERVSYQAGNSPRPKAWKVTGDMEEPPDSLNEPTIYEREYMNYFAEFIDLAVALNNAGATRGAKTVDAGYLRSTSATEEWNYLTRLGFNFRVPFDQHWPHIQAILGNTENRLNRENTLENRKGLEQELRSLKRNMPTVLANFVRSTAPTAPIRLANITQSKEIFGAVLPIRKVLESLNGVPALSNPDNTRQAAFVHEHTELLLPISADLETAAETHRIVQSVELHGNSTPESVFAIDTSDPKRFQRGLTTLLDNLWSFFDIATN